MEPKVCWTCCPLCQLAQYKDVPDETSHGPPLLSGGGGTTLPYIRLYLSQTDLRMNTDMSAATMHLCPGYRGLGLHPWWSMRISDSHWGVQSLSWILDQAGNYKPTVWHSGRKNKKTAFCCSQELAITAGNSRPQVTSNAGEWPAIIKYAWHFKWPCGGRTKNQWCAITTLLRVSFPVKSHEVISQKKEVACSPSCSHKLSANLNTSDQKIFQITLPRHAKSTRQGEETGPTHLYQSQFSVSRQPCHKWSVCSTQMSSTGHNLQ